jgi:hypothetical protein
MSRRTEKPSGTQSVAPFGRIRRFHSRRIAGEAGTASYLLAPSSSSQSSPGVTRSKYRPCAIRESLRPQSIVATKGRWGAIADNRGGPGIRKGGAGGGSHYDESDERRNTPSIFCRFFISHPRSTQKANAEEKQAVGCSDAPMHCLLRLSSSHRDILLLRLPGRPHALSPPPGMWPKRRRRRRRRGGGGNRRRTVSD